jgi:hypothetical protein
MFTETIPGLWLWGGIHYFGNDLLLWGGIYLVANTVSAFIAASVWSKRGGDYTDGFWLGLFLSVIGIFIAAIVRPYRAWLPSDGAMQPPPQVPDLVDDRLGVG